jgi:hypothetical protein
VSYTFNVGVGYFGGPLKAGDLIAVGNAIEHIRKKDAGVKFHLLPGSIDSADYCQKMYKKLLNHTDYFDENKGQYDLAWRKVNLFDFRDISGDLVVIKNDRPMTPRKLVVCPLFDAPYNRYRNWPSDYFNDMMGTFRYKWLDYFEMEKVLCIKDTNFVLAPKFLDAGWKMSYDYDDNLNHIMEAEIFCGGDTATSHFAGSLDRGPRELIYYYSSRALVHSLPMHYRNGKGKLVTYWIDFEGTSFEVAQRFLIRNQNEQVMPYQNPTNM